MEKFRFKKGELAPAYADTLQELSKIGSDLFKHKFKDEIKFRKALEKLSDIYLENIQELNNKFQHGGPIQEISEDLEENLEKNELEEELSESELQDDNAQVNCLCFSTFLKEENPELVEALAEEDINSNPSIREKVDEAYKKFTNK